MVQAFSCSKVEVLYNVEAKPAFTTIIADLRPPKPAASAGEGGERGIRTLGTVARTTVFETVPFDRSGISPKRPQK
jgi:hypothetical protein